MSEASARLLKEACENPQPVDELWATLKRENESTDWDLEEMLGETQ